MRRPATHVRTALRAALRRRYGYAALRVLRRGLSRANAAHLSRQLGPREYDGTTEARAVYDATVRALRALRRRWPRLNWWDPRADP